MEIEEHLQLLAKQVQGKNSPIVGVDEANGDEHLKESQLSIEF